MRVIVHGCAPGAWNMAVDEALLRAPQNRWTLRFYAWDRPTVSLGYAQPFDTGVDADVARRMSMPVIRRPTGGRAVLHADEITYSLAAPIGEGALSGGISTSYRRIAAGLQAGLRMFGVDVDVERSGAALAPAHKGPCFSARTRYELSVGGRKLVGSAQRRRDNRLLQHGSILLGPLHRELWAALGPGFEEAAAASVGLSTVLGSRPVRRKLVACLAHGVAAELGLGIRNGALSGAERRAARRFRARYGDPVWTRRR